MLEIVVIGILVLAVAGGVVVRAGEAEARSRTWPAIGTGLSRSEPAEEGAPVSGDAARIPDEEMPKAA